jgi:hypothetical protein
VYLRINPGKGDGDEANNIGSFGDLSGPSGGDGSGGHRARFKEDAYRFDPSQEAEADHERYH